MRLRNSVVIEVALLVGAVTLGDVIWRGATALRVDTWYANSEHLTLAGWWYAFISLNVFRFVLLRWYFRLILWYLFLWRVARLPLRLNALHPDGAAGLGFLAGSASALLPVLLAHTITLAGVKREASREYGTLAMRYVDEFRDKWLGQRRAGAEGLVGSADIQSLSDIAGANESLRNTGFFPIGYRAVVTLAVVVALPFAPLLL